VAARRAWPGTKGREVASERNHVEGTCGCNWGVAGSVKNVWLQGGVLGSKGDVWPQGGVAGSEGHLWLQGRRGRNRGVRVVARWVWPGPRRTFGARFLAGSKGITVVARGVAGSDGDVWLQGVHCRVCRGRVAARGRGQVQRGVWLVVWAPFGRFGACPISQDPSGCHGGVANPLAPIWLPWRHGPSPWPCLALVGAWPFPLAFSGCLGGVARPLGPVWLSWGRG